MIGKWLGRSFAFMVLIITMCICSACAPLQRDKVVVEETRRQDPESQAWTDGVMAFQQGKFQEALEIFRTLREKSHSEDIRRKALYGMACTRLILACNAYEFQQALELWEEWTVAAPVETNSEDPRMMWPLIYRIKPPPEMPKAGSKAILEPQRRIRCEELLLEKKEEIKQLKHQLEALEAIHRSIKEKKKEVTSP